MNKRFRQRKTYIVAKENGIKESMFHGISQV